MKFKVGDMVYCVDNEEYEQDLINGKKYKILKIRCLDPTIDYERSVRSNGIEFMIITEKNFATSFCACRFILPEIKQNRKLLK